MIASWSAWARRRAAAVRGGPGCRSGAHQAWVGNQIKGRRDVWHEVNVRMSTRARVVMARQVDRHAASQRFAAEKMSGAAIRFSLISQ